MELFEEGIYPYKNYDIYTLEEADEAINQSLDFFITRLIPKYDFYSSYKEIEIKINIQDTLVNDRFLSSKMKYGLILAKLVCNPNYEALKSKYRELLKDWSDWDKQELEKVIAFLDSHTQEELKQIAESS